MEADPRLRRCGEAGRGPEQRALLAAAPAACTDSRSADVPSPAAIALAKRKCSACQRGPATREPPERLGARVHELAPSPRGAPAAEWALVRDYLGVPPDTR
jgi:hypothetical protein